MSRSGSPRSVRNPAKKGTPAFLTSAIAHAAWAPLQHRVFRMLWVASIISYIGSWMHEVGAGWLMTSLAPTPLMVALVQAATTAPVFLLALPAGALADIVDRRRHLIVAQTWMTLPASVLGVPTPSEKVNSCSSGAVIQPASVSTPSTLAVIIIQV